MFLDLINCLKTLLSGLLTLKFRADITIGRTAILLVGGAR